MTAANEQIEENLAGIGESDEVDTVPTDDTSSTDEITQPAEKEKEVKQVRIVRMEDGTDVNFGTRANLITSADPEQNLLTFKLASGKVINYVEETIENLTEKQKAIYLYGLLQKVKTTLAPVKLFTLIDGELVPTMENTINKQLELFKAGEFMFRDVEREGVVELTDLQRAYAEVMREQGSKPHWTDLDDIATMTEILSIWETKSPVERNKVRRHPLVAIKLATLAQKTGKVDELV